MIKSNIYKSKKEKAWNIVLVYLMIYFSSSFSLSVYSGTTRILLYAVLFALIALNYYFYKGYLYVKSGVVFLLPLIGVLSYLFNGEDIKQFELLLVYYLVSFAFVLYLDFDKWCEAYLSIIQFIAFLSIILYFTSITLPSFNEALPTTVNSGGLSTKTIFFCLAPIYGRNLGIFWEPGAFQIYLMIAIIIEYFNYGLCRRGQLAVLLVADILTFSTTAFVSIGFLIIIIIINEKIENRLKKEIGVSTLVVILIILFIVYITEKAQIDIYTTVFGKIDRYQANPTSDGTAAVRFNSMIKGFEVFVQNPILGVGKTKLNDIFISYYRHSMTTCTFINWFAVSGIFFGTLMIVGVYKFLNLLIKRKFVVWLSLCLIFILISSENMAENPSFIILVLYGFLGYHNNIHMKKIEC